MDMKNRWIRCTVLLSLHVYFVHSYCLESLMFYSRTYSVALECNPGYVIYAPVEAGIAEACDENCSGFTPKLISEINNCYWKNKCTLSVPDEPGPLIKLSSGSSVNCLGRSPSHLRMLDWYCIQEAAIRNISIVDSTITENDSPFGMIRSHDKYPWNFDQSMFNNSESFNIAFSPNIGRDKKIPLLSIDDLDIGRGYVFNTSNSSYPVKRNNVIYTEAGVQLNIIFKMLKQEDNPLSGRGLVFCYKFFRQNPGPPQSCSSIMVTERGNLTYSNCSYQNEELYKPCDQEIETAIKFRKLRNDSNPDHCPLISETGVYKCECKYKNKTKVSRCINDQVQIFQTLNRTGNMFGCPPKRVLYVKRCSCVYENVSQKAVEKCCTTRPLTRAVKVKVKIQPEQHPSCRKEKTEKASCMEIIKQQNRRHRKKQKLGKIKGCGKRKKNNRNRRRKKNKRKAL